MSEFSLQLRKISKTYGGIRANDAVDFQVRPATIHALAGENGAGKSTLMKILFGLIPADENLNAEEGIFIRGVKVNFASPLDAIRSGVGMVQQHFALAGPLTALDNVILGAEPTYGWTIDRPRAQSVLEKIAGNFLKVPWREEAQDLSVGIQQRLEILKLLFRNADILILDEPTAVLTPQEVDAFFSLLRSLREDGKTIILITHKLQEVLALCDEVTILRHGRVSGHFSTKGLTRETIVQAMIGRDIKPVIKEKLDVGEILIEVKNLTIRQAHRGSLNSIGLTVRKNEIVGVAGVEGNGQQALVEALLGMEPYKGEILFKNLKLPQSTCFIRENLNFGLISEDRQEQSLWIDASIKENVAIGFCKKLSVGGFLGSFKMRKNAEKVLKDYNVKMTSVDQHVKYLSGGNQQKVVVAREVTARRPEFLIASQPTRGVDVGAIEFIHQQLLKLRKNGAGILLISSELEELCSLSDRIIVLYEGKIVQSFEGPYFDVKKIGSAMTCGEQKN